MSLRSGPVEGVVGPFKDVVVGMGTEGVGGVVDGGAFTVDQVRFVNLIVDELTSSGVMEPKRMFESPYTDHAPTGPELFFPETEVGDIVRILGEIKDRAMLRGAA